MSVTINAQDFGAVGDGATNDTAAVQAALDAAYNAGGGSVYLPSGVYLVTGQSDYPTGGTLQIRDNVEFYGDGMGTSVIKLADGWNGSVTGMLRTPYAQENSNIFVHDLTLDGNRAHTTGKVDGWFNGYAPGQSGQDSNITLQRVEIMNMSGYGFDPHEQTVNLTIRDSIAHGNGLDGFVADFILGDSVYENNVAYGNDRHGFNIVTSTEGITLRGNVAYDNGSSGIVIQRGSEDIPIVSDVMIEGGAIYGNAKEGIQVKLTDNVIIRDVDVYENGTNGIRIFGSRDVVVEDSHIFNNSQSKNNGYSEVRIQDYDDMSGISGLLYPSLGTVLRSNIIDSGGAIRSNYGIEEIGVTDYSLFYGNTIAGTAKAEMLISGLHSRLTPPDITGTEGADYYNTKTGNQLLYLRGGGDEALSGSGNDTLYGGEGNDTLSGENDHDLLFGGGGNDHLRGGKGVDTLFGGTGDDSLSGHSDDDMLDGGFGDDTLGGDAGNDALEGWYGNDLLQGNSGGDTLFGGHGDDTLQGNNDSDRLDGGADADILTGGAGTDIFRFSNAMHSTSIHYDLITDFEPGTDRIDLDGLGFVSLTENPVTASGELRLDYDALSNLTLLRSDQSDFAVALLGNFVGILTNNDVIFSALPPGATPTLEGGAGKDTLTGGDAGEWILGHAGDDKLYGNAGNDTLDGGAGKDTLEGGAGADVYRFSHLLDSTAGGGYDRVVGFTVGLDRFDLTGLGFIGLDNDGGATESGELRLTYSSSSDRTYVRSDQLSFELYLDGNYTSLLTNSDFIF